MNWITDTAKPIDNKSIDLALARQSTLTKPAGSLGRLEELAVAFSGWQGTEKPIIDTIQIVVFAADHGIATQAVSAFPQQVTVEMIKNFCRGGAAISVLARQLETGFLVVNMGTANETSAMTKLVSEPVAAGTNDFSKTGAMTFEQLQQALLTGADRVNPEAHMFIGGEMGIGNTSSATALGCAYMTKSAADLVGRGSGIDDSTLTRKTQLIDQALDLHAKELINPLSVLQLLGGFEIAALTGAYIRAAQVGVPILVDGFISTAAAIAAVAINPSCRQWMFFSHQSNEQGHRSMLDFLQAKPSLDFGMRLGEGCGAALCVPLIKSACLLQSQMATFEEAAVSEA